MADIEEEYGDGDYEKDEEDDMSEGYADTDIEDLDESSGASELMQFKMLLNEYESNLLRIPMIKLYFTERNKRNLPFEARLLPFSCRLPKQMTRGPFVYGEGKVLRRIDEDSQEEIFKFEEEEESRENTSLNIDSNESILSDPERNETGSASSLHSVNEQWKRPQLDTIHEASAIDERIFEFPLTQSQRRIISENETRLTGIAEVRRIHEMAEEEDDEDELDARIWESDDTPYYCKKTRKIRDC
ncbi:uncharacterized protein LOC124157602 [Ischnura elegans]|uniref:uncharacterized protein LOC124157602 n=1 Tax=Ischnura elegans TaxID=197161 RepID=UPI001ED8A5BE|nr:uncharacterized protein LOC124157602 [Ischnura elegans]